MKLILTVCDVISRNITLDLKRTSPRKLGLLLIGLRLIFHDITVTNG